MYAHAQYHVVLLINFVRLCHAPIWNYFDVGEDSKVAICKTCNHPVSREGKTIKTFNTTTLVHHLIKGEAHQYVCYI